MFRRRRRLYSHFCAALCASGAWRTGMFFVCSLGELLLQFLVLMLRWNKFFTRSPPTTSLLIHLYQGIRDEAGDNYNEVAYYDQDLSHFFPNTLTKAA